MSEIETTKRFLAEVLSSAGRMSEDEITAAHEEFTDMLVTAATIRLWRDGRARFEWDREAQCLVVHAVTTTQGAA
ncbi:hypothetical protein Srot_0890 [Segniliparus rotundus DSM 44985]|uniref:Uncharacterized protein n=1 Tax=Segniliparus rotundus (strain ATCC BAA-972 / CDC 1076 / CIP 108378 / DSM 44985 / JCM 13578) TaxID=640132 RepID=D6ZE87_SEGRD|nr:hypothetical protein [Segniliparus rotundus]ADG97367.1 hypothetical protein Srot_0890 [Segniliparus rotundus DSM 44985]